MQNKLLKILIFVFLSTSIFACSDKRIEQYRIYGIDYMENGNYTEAIDCFNTALKLGNGAIGNTQYDLLLYKAECLFMLKKYSEANKIYEVLLKVDKNNKIFNELYNNVNSIVGLVEFSTAINNNELDKADEILSKLIASGFEHEKSVMFNQGVLYEKKGEWKNALNTFNYYLKQYPNDEAAQHEVDFISAEMSNVNY